MAKRGLVKLPPATHGKKCLILAEKPATRVDKSGHSVVYLGVMNKDRIDKDRSSIDDTAAAIGLYGLLRSSPSSIAPACTARYGLWYEWILPIGADHCAYLTVSEDALEALYEVLYDDLAKDHYVRPADE